jgi:hypothetical protein
MVISNRKEARGNAHTKQQELCCLAENKINPKLDAKSGGCSI